MGSRRGVWLACLLGSRRGVWLASSSPACAVGAGWRLRGGRSVSLARVAPTRRQSYGGVRFLLVDDAGSAASRPAGMLRGRAPRALVMAAVGTAQESRCCNSIMPKALCAYKGQLRPLDPEAAGRPQAHSGAAAKAHLHSAAP
jgi:hypothetical protein